MKINPSRHDRRQIEVCILRVQRVDAYPQLRACGAAVRLQKNTRRLARRRFVLRCHRILEIQNNGIGAGIRSRNENLIFNTIELRAVYFPRKTVQNTSFKIMLNTGLQFRFNTIYVRQPDVVFLNTDGLNSIY